MSKKFMLVESLIVIINLAFELLKDINQNKVIEIGKFQIALLESENTYIIYRENFALFTCGGCTKNLHSLKSKDIFQLINLIEREFLMK